jgi:hypothetical protein
MTKYNSDVCYADNEQTRTMQMVIADLEAALGKLAEAAQAFLDAGYHMDRREGNLDEYYNAEGTLQGMIEAIMGQPTPAEDQWRKVVETVTRQEQGD